MTCYPWFLITTNPITEPCRRGNTTCATVYVGNRHHGSHARVVVLFAYIKPALAALRAGRQGRATL